MLDAARALWVRDRNTGAQARALGVRREPIVAADLALLCGDTLLDSMAVIAASDRFVGTSLHGCLTAWSFGVPFRIRRASGAGA